MRFFLLAWNLKYQLEDTSIFRYYGDTDYAKNVGIHNFNQHGLYYMYADMNEKYDCISRSYGKPSSSKFRDMSIRPAMVLTTAISSLNLDFWSVKHHGFDYGEYPQEKVDDKVFKKLMKLYRDGKLQPIDKQFRCMSDDSKPGEVYIYNGKKYVCFKNSEGVPITWYRVSPIHWIVDADNNIAVASEALFSCNRKGENLFVFIDRVNWFLNTCFSVDILEDSLIFCAGFYDSSWAQDSKLKFNKILCDIEEDYEYYLKILDDYMIVNDINNITLFHLTSSFDNYDKNLLKSYRKKLEIINCLKNTIIYISQFDNCLDYIDDICDLYMLFKCIQPTIDLYDMEKINDLLKKTKKICKDIVRKNPAKKINRSL